MTKDTLHQPVKYLYALGLSEAEITLYLSMISGNIRARDLVKATDIKRPTVYYLLGVLEKRGLISKTGLEGERRFSVEPLTVLEQLAEAKISEATTLKKNIVEVLPTLSALHAEVVEKPIVSFYEGKEAVIRVIKDMLYAKSKVISSVVPEDNFFWQVGEDFVYSFVKERILRNIKTRNLWEKSIDQKLMEDYYYGPSEVRILPSVMHGKFRTAIFLFDDKTLYVSSLKNCYCVLMTSQEYKDTMQAWFEGLWVGSKTV